MPEGGCTLWRFFCSRNPTSPIRRENMVIQIRVGMVLSKSITVILAMKDISTWGTSQVKGPHSHGWKMQAHPDDRDHCSFSPPKFDDAVHGSWDEKDAPRCVTNEGQVANAIGVTYCDIAYIQRAEVGGWLMLLLLGVVFHWLHFCHYSYTVDQLFAARGRK